MQEPCFRKHPKCHHADRGECAPCPEGLVGDGAACVDVSAWGSLRVEFEQGTEVTDEMLGEIRDAVSDETGRRTAVSVIDKGAIRISIDCDDDAVLRAAIEHLERCRETKACGSSFDRIKAVSVYESSPGSAAAPALVASSLVILFLSVLY